MKIIATQRPFLLAFASGTSPVLLTSEEAQRLLDGFPAVTATRNRVVLQGGNDGRPHNRTTLQPATHGGGPAFIVEKGR